MNRPMSGITLIELMVVVALVSILAAIAYPSYRDQVLRSRRTDATTALTTTAAEFERCFTRFNAYNAACAPALPFDTPEGTYRISASAATTATTFSLQAVPLGGQAADAKCGTLSLDSANVRGETGSLTVNDCW